MQIGYDPDFIGDGIRVPMPTFNRSLARSVLRKPGVLRNDIYSDHIHFTLVMNESTRQLIYSAYNINQSAFREDAGGKRDWRTAKDIGSENQLGNEYYKDRQTASGRKIPNPYDRGHMVMRFNNMWGDTKDEADKAGKATFIYANSSLQHENLNRDEWRELEMEIVRKLQDDTNDRLCIFTGPIYGDLDRHINLSDRDSARVPSGFFKVICFRLRDADPGDELGVYAFGIFQDPTVLRNKNGHATVKSNREYQLTISELQELTGIRFDRRLYERNPLFYFDRRARNRQYNVSFIPERVPLNRDEDLVLTDTSSRSTIEPLSKRRIAIMSAMIDPIGDERKGEWVSLQNRSSKSINVKGWRLIDNGGRSATLSGKIKAGDSLCIRGSALGTIMLSNRGGALMLHDAQNGIIDHVSWSREEVRRIGQGIAYIFERGQ